MTNVGAWSAQQSTTAEGIQRVEQGIARNPSIPNAMNTWDVELGTGQPLSLTVESMSAGGSLQLGGLQLTELGINGTTGDFNVNYANANSLADGGSISIALTSGDLTINNVLNSHANRIETRSTGGNQTFEFGRGDLMQDLLVAIQSTSGDIILRIPIGTAATITFMGASGRVLEASPEFVRVNPGVYETAEYANADLPRMQIAVRTVAGDLRLVSVPPL
jgi:hypothetical protein